MLFVAMRTMSEKLTLPERRSWWISSWLPSWCPTSPSQLKDAENRMLQPIQVEFSRWYVPISNGNSLWTLFFPPDTSAGDQHMPLGEEEKEQGEERKGEEEERKAEEEGREEEEREEGGQRTPLVLLHGFGTGVGLWALNLAALSRDRPLYALDLLGFGRSSRPTLSSDAQEVEEQLVQSLEEWRAAVGAELMILLGHDLGAYLSISYALTHPHRVQRLVLVEPWGFAERPNVPESEYLVPEWLKAMAAAMSLFNPLSALRLAGPLGLLLLQMVRSDFKQKYSSLFNDDTVSEYIYHLNVQTPSGETAFWSMSVPYGWARHPMLQRMGVIHPSISISIIYGSRSSIDGHSANAVRESRPNSHTQIIVIRGAGHYVFADQSEDFNQTVLRICNTAEKEERGERRRRRRRKGKEEEGEEREERKKEREEGEEKKVIN